MPDDRAQMILRLKLSDMRRLEETAKERRQTKQALVEGAVLRDIGILPNQASTPAVPQTLFREQPQQKTQPVGLGIIERLSVTPTNLAPPPAPTPVVVNVNAPGAGSSSSTGDVDRLAAFVAGGKDFERTARLRMAVSILHETATTDEERKVLAARLDEAIAAKTKSSEAASSGISKLARITFDKLKELL